MTNPSKDKGTAWETAIVNWLRLQGAKNVERRTLKGAKDRGDIAGIPGVVIEAKNCQRLEIGKWVDEADREAAADAIENGRPSMGVVWAKRRGKTWPGFGYLIMDPLDFVELLKKAGYL